MQQGVQADFVGHESIVRQVAVDSVSQHATLARTGYPHETIVSRLSIR